jgi:hypothetical protein
MLAPLVANQPQPAGPHALARARGSPHWVPQGRGGLESCTADQLGGDYQVDARHGRANASSINGFARAQLCGPSLAMGGSLARHRIDPTACLAAGKMEAPRLGARRGAGAAAA